LYYRLLHYYVFFHLKHRTKNADWLRSQFLPMGNPDTEWHYGHLAAGEQLGVRFDAVHQCSYNTYVAFYNWASFPVDWCKIQALEWRSAPFAEHVGYAVRRVRKVDARATQSSDSVFEALIYPSKFATVVTPSPPLSPLRIGSVVGHWFQCTRHRSRASLPSGSAIRTCRLRSPPRHLTSTAPSQASTYPFATQGAVYRRQIDSNGPLQPYGAEACRSGSTASPIPTASRPEIQWPL
jgi:hypothetical protein